MENNIISFLNNKGINEVFRKITIKEVEDYINKHIGDNLEVGKQYKFNSRDSIHFIITENIKMGLHELFGKYDIDYAELFKMFIVKTWGLDLSVSYETISVWETIGSYHFHYTQRKNASISNDRFILTEIPTFTFYNNDDKDLSIYDLYMGFLRIQREKMISKYEGEICSYKKCIADNKKMIEKLEDILL